jgi:hypothetical protein
MIDEYNNDYEDEDLASFIEDGEEEDSTDEDDLASFLDEDEEDLDLASFLDEGEDDDEDENDLASFLDEDAEDAVEGDDEDDLASFLEEDEADDDDADSFLDEEDDNDFDDDLVAEDAGQGWMDSLTGGSKPSPILAYKKENRKARLDITKNSKEDHRYIKRYTKKEIEDQLKKDYRYMLGKPYMVIQPLTILAEYPFKKKSSDADIPNKHNVDLDYVICIGKILKWRGTEQFKGKPYRLGRIMYLKRGDYWVNGKIQTFDPHFAIVLSKSYKRIKSKRIRDLFLPLKQRLRSGKPFGIYKEFPIIVKRSGSYS